jgi:hypothetical protein
MMPRFFSCPALYRFAYAAGLLTLAASFMVPRLSAQTETATVLGRVTDNTGAIVKGVEIEVRNIDTNVATTSSTNAEGLYAIHSLPPGRYIISVHKQGFKTVSLTGLNLNVQDNLIRNFILQIGAVSESITVSAESTKINTTDATVSTVIDRNFAENLPMNGRSFQSLIQLTPGAVAVATNQSDAGQFSINGQRADSNYWMVDGVSANMGTAVSPTGTAGNGLSGSLGSFSVLGGTNSLVSLDAMQEFRIQTSTYAPEFGRTPGGQISILTRSGTNQFHGTMFDYLRNDALDASNWFNGFAIPRLQKAKERQNDFGGTFAGPIFKDRAFFFFSYEGLRLRLPQSAITTVPDLASRQSATVAMQPFLNSFPFDPNQPTLGNGTAQFNASYSNPASLDAYSLRIDHNLTDRVAVFGRYSYSPSEIVSRGGTGPLSDLSRSRIIIQTATVGATVMLAPTITNDLRANYSRTNASSTFFQDNFGGATPISSLPFPSPFTQQNAELGFFVIGLQNGFTLLGPSGQNVQKQINITESVSIQKGRHSLKFGVDFRRLSPIFDPAGYSQTPIFLGVAAAVAGRPFVTTTTSTLPTTFLFRNLGSYAQDTWRLSQRTTVTYGVRWDVDFVPQSLKGPSFPAVIGFDLNDLSGLSLAPAGTQPYATSFANVAPRIGVAYQLSQNPDWQRVLRGGFGVFYDLASSEMGNQIFGNAYPFGAFVSTFGGAFPANPPLPAPAVTPPPSASAGLIHAIDPHLKSPYSLEWNLSFEQGLGKQQVASASYVGAIGRKLLQSTSELTASNPNIPDVTLLTNTGTSDYHALQIQFRRQMSKNLQVLSSYVWSHSIDTGSAGSVGATSNVLIPSTIAGSNRGPSDFDIRHAFNLGITYDIPSPAINGFTNAVLSGWSLENFALMRSAPPVDISDGIFNALIGGFSGDIRPDLKPGEPLYLFGAACASALQALGSLAPGQVCPGGKGFNPAAFLDPPIDPLTQLPLRQGTLPRNALRGFGATQWDLAIHRDFPIRRESVHLQFRAEMFNVLNHPDFGPPQGAFNFAGFGVSHAMLGTSLAGSASAAGAFNPLYQIGGPRSIQMALKLVF